MPQDHHIQSPRTAVPEGEDGTAAVWRGQERRWLLTSDFRWMWWSQVLSQVADGVSRLALLWFVYAVTGSALQTSVIGLLQTLPPILFGPFIGVWVDRLPKKAILIGSDVARGLLIGGIPCWVSVEMFTVETLYVLVFLYGIATAMFVPTLSASVPSLVSRHRFVAANALLQSTTSIGIVVGPALSGLGIAFAGSQEVLCVNALIYLGSAVCLLPIRLPHRGSAGLPGRMAVTALRDLLEGLRFTFVSQRTILVLTLMASIYTFGTGAFTTLFPVFGKKMLSLGPVEVGYLWSWLGVGLLVVSLGLVAITQWRIRHRVRVVTVSAAIGGIALCALVWTQDLIAATVIVTVIGMTFGIWTPIAWGLIQEFSPAHMVGRVMAIYATVATMTSMAGMTFFGWVTERYNSELSVVGIGFVLFLLALASAWFSHRVTDLPGTADAAT